MKYQAHIKHVSGAIITVIWDDDKERFMEEVESARRDLVAYLGESDFEYDKSHLFIEIV